MKTKHLLIVLISFFSTTQSIKAQIFKKLQKRVEEKVENVIVEKTANKAADKTSNSMDEVFNVNLFEAGKEKASPNLVADSYDFTWKYSLKMTSKKNNMIFDYYLHPNATYFGFTSLAMKNMFSVMDNDKKITVMFMESKGNNIGMVNQIPDTKNVRENNNANDYTFTTLPDKTINGFRCKGVKATNETYEMIMYLTKETEVSFDNVFRNGQVEIPTQLKNYFKKEDQLLMIFMDMKNVKDNEQQMQMECVGLEKVKKSIKKSDYKFM